MWNAIDIGVGLIGFISALGDELQALAYSSQGTKFLVLIGLVCMQLLPLHESGCSASSSGVVMFQVSDTEDMDVKNIVGPCVGMPQNISEHLPDDIFEEDTKSSISSANQSSPLKLEQKSAFTSVPVKDESDKISLDSFIKCEEGDDGLGLAVTEDDMAIASAETALSGIKFELDDDCIDVETVSEQIPGECSCLIFALATK